MIRPRIGLPPFGGVVAWRGRNQSTIRRPCVLFIEPAVPHKPEQRDAGRFREIDRQAGRRGDGSDDGNAGEERLLNDLERRTAAHDKHTVGAEAARRGTGGRRLCPPRYDGRYPPRSHRSPVSREDARGVEPARFLERRLPDAQP